MLSAQEHGPLKKYLGIVFIGKESRHEFSLLARDSSEAFELAKREFGDHPISVWNEEDANSPRR
jgi:hypothetical protein